MKTLTLILALTLTPALALAKETSTLIKVNGWHCGGCTAMTEQALRKINGVKAVKTDLQAGTAEITYDDAVANPAEFDKAIEKAGYHIVK